MWLYRKRTFDRRPLWSSSLPLVFVGRSGFSGLSGLATFRVTQWLGQDLRSELLVQMTNLSADWHERTMLGEKLGCIDQDVEQISQYGADIGNTVFRTVVFFLVNLAIMMALNWRMTTAVLPLLPLFLWVRLCFREKIQSRADRSQVKVGNATGDLAEHLNAVPQFQILGAEEMRIGRTVGAWLELVGAQWEQRRTEVAFSISVTSILALGIFLVLGLGAHELFVGTLSIGGLVAFYAYVSRIFEPVSSAMELYSRTQRMLASARRVCEVLDTEPSVADIGTIQNIEAPLVAGIECDRVSFGYIPERLVLRNVSFRLQRSEKVALVGSSGSGMSTLSRLFARMADPSAGGFSSKEGRFASTHFERCGGASATYRNSRNCFPARYGKTSFTRMPMRRVARSNVSLRQFNCQRLSIDFHWGWRRSSARTRSGSREAKGSGWRSLVRFSGSHPF